MHADDSPEVDLDTPVDGSNRRTMIRHRREFAVTLETLQMAGTSPWPGWTQDISSEGLSLVLGRRFEAGTPVAITFDEGTTTPLTLLAKVVRVEAATGGWLLGCRFPKPVDSAEFQNLLQEVAPSPPLPEPRAEVEPEPTAPSATADTPQRVDLRAIREKLRQLGAAFHRDAS